MAIGVNRGTGSGGRLGHGSEEDVKKPKMIKGDQAQLLQHKVSQVVTSFASTHVMAIVQGISG